MSWEYKTLWLRGGNPEQSLNDLGVQGWELVAVRSYGDENQSETLYVFKREGPGPAAEPVAKLEGNVTFKGAPLATGRVILHLDDGEFVGSKVKDGKYTVSRVPTGEWRITIEGEEVPPVPSRFSSEDQSGLVVVVKAGSNTIDLNLL